MLCFTPQTRAQFLETFQADTDWWELYDRGYLDFDTYQSYSDLSDGALFSGATGYGLSTLGNSSIDIVSAAPLAAAQADTAGHRPANAFVRAGFERSPVALPVTTSPGPVARR